ncbi:MAG: hypothetical protein ACTSU5_11010 [Promethearchaeota archaeon]
MSEYDEEPNDLGIPGEEESQEAAVSPVEETEEVEYTLTDEGIPPGTPVVIDIGESTCKVGIAGEEKPIAIFPTIVGREKYRSVMVDTQVHTRSAYVGDDCANMRGVLKISYPISRGSIMNWEDYYEILTHIFYNVLRIEPSQHPVIYIEHTMTPPDTREYIAQVLLDTYKVQSLFMANSSLLALFSVGLTDGLVLEVGEGNTYIVPVANGDLYYAGVMKLNLASADIAENLRSLLLRYGHSLDFSAQKEILRDIKEKNCYVALDPQSERARSQQIDRVSYTLPDGETMVIDGETRFQAAEILFHPEILGYNTLGIPEAIIQSISRLGFAWRRIMVENIVLCGGTAKLTGFDLRLERELEALLPQLGPLPEPIVVEEQQPEPEPEKKLQDVAAPEKEVDTCPKCGATVNLLENDHTCPSCGYKFKQIQISISPLQEEEEVQLPDECPKCKKKLAEPSAFCPYCGTKIEPIKKKSAGLGSVELGPVLNSPTLGSQGSSPFGEPSDEFESADEFEDADEFEAEDDNKTIRIHVPDDPETAPFKGAAILGALSRFQNLFITKEQFVQNPALINRTFNEILY